MALEEHLEVVVDSSGFDSIIAKARELEESLKADRDAAAEMDAVGEGAGKGLDSAIAKARVLEEELRGARDAAVELDLAQRGSSRSGGDDGKSLLERAAQMAEVTGTTLEAAEAAAAAAASSREMTAGLAEQVAAITAVEKAADDAAEAEREMDHAGGKWREGIGSVDYSAATAEMDKLGEKEAEVAFDAAAMKREIRSAGLSGAEAGVAGSAGIEAFGERVKSARDAVAGLDAAVAAGDAAFGSGAGFAGAQAEAYAKLRDDATEAAGAVAAVAAAQTAADAASAGGGEGGGGFLSKLAMAPGDLAAFAGGAGVVVPAIAAVTTEAVALVSGITAATAGVGAFAALAVPSVEKVKGAYTNLTGAQSAYHAAQQIEKRDPTTSNLAAQAKALAVLQTAQARFARLSPNERGAVKGIQALKSEYQSMAKAFEPDAFKVFNKGLHLAGTLLPHLSPFAKTAANALDDLLGKADKFAKSKGFETWLNQFHKLEGPSIKAIGSGIGLVANEFGKLVTTMSGKDVAHGITAAFEAIRVGMDGLGTITKKSMQTVDDISSFIGSITHLTAKASGAVAHAVEGTTKAATVKGGGGQGLLSRFGKPITVHPPVNVIPKYKVATNKGYTNLEKTILDWEAASPQHIGPEIRLTPILDPKALKTGAGGKQVPVPATAKVTKVDASHINSAASRVKIHGATVDLSNAKLSGLAALSGTMATAGRAAGKAFSTAVGAGIESGGAAATGDAKAIAQGVRGAISGLGGAGRAAGAALGAGMAAGIEASTGAAVAAAHAMAGAVEAAAKVHLGISSPSKVFEKIGADTVAGLVIGLEGGKAQVAAAMKLLTGVTPLKDASITGTIRKLTADVAKAYKAGQIDKTQDSQLTAYIRADNKRLMGLAKQRADIEKEIKAADALAKSVAASARQGGSIATLQGASTGPVSAGGLEEGMKTQLAAIKKFNTELKQLKKEGASKAVIRQIAQEGVAQGGAAAQALLAGGKGAIQKISQLQHQIAQAAKGLGKTAANASYESGAQIGKGLAAGLKGELKGILSAMKSLAKQLIDEIKKQLKIKSPSGVMEEIGTEIPAGLAVGVSTGAPQAVAAMKKLGAVTVGAFHADPVHAAASHGGSSHAPAPTIVNVHNHIAMSGMQMNRSLQSFSLDKARRNVATGLKLPNRQI